MKRIFILLGLCSLAVSMSWAAGPTLERLTPVQLAQMRLNAVNEKSEALPTTRSGKMQDRGVLDSSVKTVPTLERVAPIHVSGDDWTRLSKAMKQVSMAREGFSRMKQSQGEYDISWYDPNQKKYELTTSEQMAGFSVLLVNGYNLDEYEIRLGADVDLSAYDWEPIGSDRYPFNGTFDGGGHTISGMKVSAKTYAGLFGCLENAKIRNVMLAADCQVDGSYAGALAGKSWGGSVKNCVTEAVVTGNNAGGMVGLAEETTFELCVSNGAVEVKGQSDWEGTFTGSSINGWDNSAQAVQVTISRLDAAPDSLVMSLRAYLGVDFSIGGKLGDDGRLYIPMGQFMGMANENTMYLYLYGISGTTAYADSYFVATLSADGLSLSITAPTTTIEALSVLGMTADDPSSLTPAEWLMLPLSLQKQFEGGYGTFTGKGGIGWSQCYYRSDYSAAMTNVTGKPQSVDEMKSDRLVETLNAYVAEKGDATPEISYHLWEVGASGPVLSDAVYSSSSWITEGNYDTSWYDAGQNEFVLTTAAQLAGLSRLTSDGINFRYCTIRLGADIDLTGLKWAPIGSAETPFQGLFDGAGHEISGLQTGLNNRYSGLFGVAEQVDIRNLMLANSCQISGSIVGSLVGQMTDGTILNCRSDAKVAGLITGGLVGMASSSSVQASIFNGSVSQRAVMSKWEGSFSASVRAPFEGESEIQWPISITISAGDQPNEYVITWRSTRYTIAPFTMTAMLGADDKLHIPANQLVGTYSVVYDIVLVSPNGADEFVLEMSDDENTITCTSADSYMLMSVYRNGENLGSIDGLILPFDAARQDASLALLGGLVGSQDQTVVENSYYRVGCLPAGEADTEQALDESELLSQARVDALNASVADIVASDFWIESLQRWTLGADGPVLSTEKETTANWWTSEGNYDIAWYNESQSEFALSTPAQLAGLAYLVWNGHNFKDKTVTLTQDIDLSGHLWVPIGLETRNALSEARFYGTFDGGGHTIHHLGIDVTGYSCARGALSRTTGLFGSVGGTIRNVTLADDCSIRQVAAGGQYCYVGGICGLLNDGTIDNCHSWAQIEAHSSCGESYAGGILGFDNTSYVISNSANHGSVLSVSDYNSAFASGVVAVNGRVINVYNTGAVSGRAPIVYVGGVGAQYVQVYNAYHTGSLSAEGITRSGQEPTVRVSPLVYNYGSSVENGYYDVACVADTTGLNAIGTGMQADAMKTVDFARLLTENATAMMSNDPNMQTLVSWEIRAGENGGFPVFGDAIDVGGWWTSAGNYDISWYDASRTGFTLSTPAQLAGLAYLVNHGTTFEGKSILLDSDIDLDGLKWEPIGSATESFMGTFDGDNHTIHNLHSEIISANVVVAGLFGQIEKARVANVILADDCTVTSSSYTGGIIAYAYESEINSCISYAAVNADTPVGYAGGIVGCAMQTTIDRCENAGPVSGVVKKTGAYSEYRVYVGGIAGGAGLQSSIINSLNRGRISATGVSSYLSYAGGIVGYSQDASMIQNCYNTGEVSLPYSGSGGGILGVAPSTFAVENCYNTGVVSAGGTAYPIAPQVASGNCYYREGCVAEFDGYVGTSVSADEMKTTHFAAKLNDWIQENYADLGIFLYWKIDAGQNDGYPVFTDEDPGYSAVEAVETGVRIYPTVVSSELYVSGADEPVSFYNLAGGIELTVEPVEGVTIVDLSSLAPGVYIVRTGEYVNRIIKR